VAALEGFASRKIRSVLTNAILTSCDCALASENNDTASTVAHLSNADDLISDFKVILRGKITIMPLADQKPVPS
jgi:hypothetical protein